MFNLRLALLLMMVFGIGAMLLFAIRIYFAFGKRDADYLQSRKETRDNAWGLIISCLITLGLAFFYFYSNFY